jgi:D-aminoacyl-tRNA deacylase
MPVKIALISSRIDPAGRNIRSHIESLIESSHAPAQPHQFEFLETEGRLINEDHIDRRTDADLIFFLSRHASERPQPVLTVHVSGNFHEAALGGKEGSLPPAAPEWMHALLRELSLRAPPAYRVSYESTHHGPTELQTPSLFVEIGSTEKEWNDPDAGAAVAMSVLSARPVDVIRLIGFGGTHYAQRQTDIAGKSRGAFGHIAPGREVPTLDNRLIREMQQKTRAVAAYIDRKALASAEIVCLEKKLQETGLILLRESDLTAIADLPWETYLQIRRMAEQVDRSSECHIHRMKCDMIPEFFELHEELLTEALKANEAAFVAGLDKIPVVHISTPKKAILPLFITGSGERAQVLHDLITLCVKTISHKETIEIAGDQLSIYKSRFDPIIARELGVTEGPLCGELMNGHEIRIGDRFITPAMVRKTMVKKIRIPGLENVTYEVNR